MSKKAGHELNDANAKALIWFAIALALGFAAIQWGMRAIFFHFRARQAEYHQPQLQSNSSSDLKTYLQREQKLLSSYGWIDKKTSQARIPIERAMDLIVTQPNKHAAVKNIQFEQHLGQVLPQDAVFTDEQNRQGPLAQYFRATPIILVFSYFECPNLCTLVLNGLVQALQNMPGTIGQDYQVLSISIDPAEKPPLALAKRRAYLARLGITETQKSSRGVSPWHFLTGSEDQIRKVTSAAGFQYYWDPKSGQFAHPSGIIVVTPHGIISKYFFGIQFDPKKIHEALDTASHERKGSWTEEILLYCFHYDPRTSRNGALIMRVLRVVSAIGVLCIFILLAFLFTNQKKETSA